MDKPTLNFTNDVDQVEVAMAFGYYKGEPTVAMFHEELLILIPKGVLQIALEQGWEEHSLRPLDPDMERYHTPRFNGTEGANNG